LPSLECCNEVTTAADAEMHDQFEEDLFVIPLEEFRGANLRSREVRENGREEGIDGLNLAHCVCGKPIIGDVYKCAITSPLFP